VNNDTFWSLSATDWTAIMALLTAGLLATAVLAALYARRQVRLAREQSEEARKSEREATRPYVIVTIEPSLASRRFFDLVVRNIGQRPALHITITLDPTPVRAQETEGFVIAKIKMLNEPVAMIAPGQEMRAFYDSHVDRHGRDLPTSHTVSLTYQDSSRHSYTETAVLDIDAMKGTMFADVKTLHDLGKSLAEIQKTLKNASILTGKGSVEVDASVEFREKKEERVVREQAEMQERHQRRSQVLQSNRPDLALAARPTESNPHEESLPGHS
jgi:hypothetical protein